VFNIAIAAAAKVKRAIERKMEGMEHTPISDPEGHLRGKHIRLAIDSVDSGEFRGFTPSRRRAPGQSSSATVACEFASGRSKAIFKRAEMAGFCLGSVTQISALSGRFRDKWRR
jgi:hypothetical protein